MGVLVAAPLPLLAWWAGASKGLGRRDLVTIIVAASVLSDAVVTAWLLSTAENTGQHSMGAGLARFAYGLGFPLCQLVASALILGFALSTRRRATGGGR